MSRSDESLARKRAKDAERMREWHKANPEKAAEKCRKWREANPGYTAEYSRKYNETHREERRQYQQKTRERHADNAHKWREKNPESHARSQRKWREANREKRAESGRKYREANPPNPEKARERVREWRKANPDKYRVLHRIVSQTRRARKKGSSGRITAKQIRDLLQRQSGKCAGCEMRLDKKYHLDHVMPLALGGLHKIENAQILCGPCNLKKGKLTPDEWSAKLKRLFPAKKAMAADLAKREKGVA